MTHRTLYLLVTCCVEQTRFDVLKQVVQNLKEEQVWKELDIKDDVLVFDNGSTIPGTLELLTDSFKKVYRSPTNEGFWSAINWVLHNIDSKYEYIYVIESDHIHFALEKVANVERFLDANPDVGGVRAQEFVVAERHLYDKSNQRPDSRAYAWVNQRHHKTGKPIYIDETDVPGFYRTNFLSQLHSINRIKPFKEVFAKLEEQSRDGQRFSELDYQKMYAEIFPEFGVIDGGLFHAKLTWGTGAVAGSFVGTGTNNYKGPLLPDANGYQETRVSIITPPEKMNVEAL